jgi:hypothetical protein
MSNGAQPLPRFHLVGKEIQDLHSRGCYSWVCYATTLLRFVSSGLRPRVSRPLPFRLDSCTFVSAIPEGWLTGTEQLAPFLGRPVADPIRYQTAAGEGQGRMARAVQVRFVDAPVRSYRFDFVLTAGLEHQDYGLISLRDVMRHFIPQVEGTLRIGNFGELFELPDLVLVPHGWQRIKYRCPNCGIEVWRRPGLHVGCNDCTRVLVSP